MLKIIVVKDKIEKAIKQLRRKVSKTKLKRQLYDRKFFKKKSDKKRLQLQKAKYVEKKRIESEDIDQFVNIYYIMYNTKQMKGDKDFLFGESYKMLTKDFTKSVNKFIVFKDGKKNVEIEHGIGQRSLYIDVLISHFENKEEYEKCKNLLKLKELVIMAGD